MELQQLLYFVAVSEEGNFTRAAERLHVAQPGVSVQIRKLERELGQELLDRSGRVVKLTQAGEAALPYARAALAAVENVRSSVDEVAGLMRGHLSVGTVRSISATGLDPAGLLAGFHEQHPGVGISLDEDESVRMFERLREGTLDVAFVGIADDVPEGIEVRSIYEDPLVIALCSDDPLSTQREVPLRAVESHNIITLPKGTGLRSRIDRACAEAGFRPRITFEASDPQVLASLAGKGLGAAIMPASLVSASSSDVCAVSIANPRPYGRIAIAWKTGDTASPAARKFVAIAQSVYGFEGGAPS